MALIMVVVTINSAFAQSDLATADPLPGYEPMVLPGNFFYPAKLSFENVRMSFTINPEKKYELAHLLAARRVKEIVLAKDRGVSEKELIRTNNRLGELVKIADEQQVSETTRTKVLEAMKHREIVLRRVIERHTDMNKTNANDVQALTTALNRVQSQSKALSLEGKNSR